MTKLTKKIITIRSGSRRLDIHPDEWPTIQQLVINALALEADPPIPLDELPQTEQVAVSPLNATQYLGARLTLVPLDRPLRGHYRDSFRPD